MRFLLGSVVGHNLLACVVEEGLHATARYLGPRLDILASASIEAMKW